jgi:RNA repair pathway DNA polymerase beta family
MERYVGKHQKVPGHQTRDTASPVDNVRSPGDPGDHPAEPGLPLAIQAFHPGRAHVHAYIRLTLLSAGAELAANADRFVSRLAAGRYLGYLGGQKAAMTGQAGAHTNRPELVAVHGYDPKYAMHTLRLGLQGIELLTTGRITLPVPEPHRAYLRSIRRGERPLAEVLDAVSDAEARLARLQDSAAMADEPDRAWVDDWLHRSYLDFWGRDH